MLCLSSLVCELTILSANLLSPNTITRMFHTRQELQKRSMRDVPDHYEYNETNSKPMNEVNTEQSKNVATCVIVND